MKQVIFRKIKAGADYADDLALLTKSPTQAWSQLHCLEQAERSIDLYVNTRQSTCILNKMEPSQPSIVDLTSCSCVGTITEIHHLDSDETHGQKGTWEIHKNATVVNKCWKQYPTKQQLYSH